jgi:hypothetical protein
MGIRRVGGVAAVALAAVIVAGCGVGFKDELAGKQVSKKKVRVSFTLCKEDEGVCATWNSSGSDARVLIGFRVPKGTKPPQEFASTSGLPVHLTRNASYKGELNAKAPKGKKYKWFGYLSDVLDLESEDEAAFEIRMKLPRDFDRKRFKVRPVAGFTPAENTEIDCGNDPFDPAEGGGEPNSFCIYAPREDQIGDNLKIKVKKQKD